MIIMVLVMSGITLIYAGVLTMPESLYAGIVMSLLGVLLTIKPAVHLGQYLRSLSTVQPRSSEKRGRGEGRVTSGL